MYVYLFIIRILTFIKNFKLYFSIINNQVISANSVVSLPMNADDFIYFFGQSLYSRTTSSKGLQFHLIDRKIL